MADFIELTPVLRPASHPDGDLACDITIATDVARSGLRESLEAAMLPPVRDIKGGVEVTFARDAWPAVMRYIELESGCCSFLTLGARQEADRVLLTVTGRPEARAFIQNIFTPPIDNV